MITKPPDMANHYAVYFESNINRLRKMIDSSNPRESLTNLIYNDIMLKKCAHFPYPG